MYSQQHGYRVDGATLFTDSETLIKAHARGHSTKCPELNTTIFFFKEHKIQPCHVVSADNPADGRSRGLEFTRLDLEKLDKLTCASNHK